MTQLAPGRKFLKVTGILYLVFGGLGVLMGLLAFAGAGVADAMAPGVGLESGIRIAAVLMLVTSAYHLVLGILGVKFCDRAEKAGLLIGLAILDVALVALGFVIASFTWLSLIGLVLPILYLVGALKNKNAHAPDVD